MATNKRPRQHRKVGKAFYLRNPRLKAAHVEVSFTKEQYDEYVKCSKDPIYFITNYMKIIHVDRGLVPFEMWDFQKKMIKTFHENRFSICKLPRQVGKSTTVVAYFLWCVLFQESYSAAIFAHKGDIARSILGRIRLAYEHLPLWLQQGVVVWNKGYIELENGSNVVAIATGSSAARGSTKNAILLDEFAFVEPNVQEEFFASTYPIIASGQTTKVMIVSTPNGMGNLFYKMWGDAERSANLPEGEEKTSYYKTLSIHWSEVPHYTEEWKKQTIANTSQRQFDQEFGCEFLGSSNTLIDAQYLRTMVWKKPIFESEEGLDILDKPVPGCNYAIVCDTSRGQELDYSAFVVIDITAMPYRTVAKFRSNTISPLLYPTVIYNTGIAYNNALVLIEINDNGQQVASILADELEYENVVKVAKDPRAGQAVTGGYIPIGSEVTVQQGVKTSKTVKRLGCALLKNLVETNKLIVTDADIIGELSTFVLTKDTYQAEEGCHDDTAMCLVLFAWMANQEYFKTVNNTSMRESLYAARMKQIEEDVSPFGIRMDGGNAEEQGLALRVGVGRDSWLVMEDDDSMELARSSMPSLGKKPANRSILGVPDDL